MTHRTTSRTADINMLRTVNQHPMTASQVLLSIGTILFAPDGGKSAMQMHSPRGRALRAIAHLGTGNTVAAINEIRGAPEDALDRAKAIFARAATPWIAYDDETHLVWAYGTSRAHAMALAGWAVVEAGGCEEMKTMRYLPADPAMERAIEEHGLALDWHVDATGTAVPGPHAHG